MRSGLVSLGASLNPDPTAVINDLRSFGNDFEDTFNEANDALSKCGDDLFSSDCAEAALKFIFISPFELGLKLLEDGFDFIIDSAKETIKIAFGPFLKAYLNAWVADINDGLKHWNELGLGFSKAVFDAQTRRDLQREDCDGLLDQADRDFCKENMGLLKVLMDPISGSHVNDFINQHLLSMLGLPDLVGELRQAFQDAAEAIESTICDAPGLEIVCNVEKTSVTAIERIADDIVKAVIKEVFGIDLEALENLQKNLGQFMALEQILPGISALRSLALVPPAESTSSCRAATPAPTVTSGSGPTTTCRRRSRWWDSPSRRSGSPMMQSTRPTRSRR